MLRSNEFIAMVRYCVFARPWDGDDGAMATWRALKGSWEATDAMRGGRWHVAAHMLSVRFRDSNSAYLEARCLHFLVGYERYACVGCVYGDVFAGSGWVL